MANVLSVNEVPVRVLVVDDEEPLRHLLRLILQRCGYQVLEASDGHEALSFLKQDPGIFVVLCDIRMPNMDGMTFLKKVDSKSVNVVMMSAFGTTDTAIECLGHGACDYITKPFRVDEIRVCIDRIVEKCRLVKENERLRTHVNPSVDLEGFIGKSAAIRDVVSVVRKVASFPTTVLFTGESGTGKELLARALHSYSTRSGGPFVPINCAALPENLLESELFGHERGAFTGAIRAHAGLFEQANGGTLLLDEIGDMPLQLQSKLLRVLQDGRVRRVGGSRDRAIDVRLVAATAKDLNLAVQERTFREDLFYRLNVVHVRVPPLRDRKDDIPLLTEGLVHRAAQRLGRGVEGVQPDVLRSLLTYDWPGNVRQLENALEHAVLMAQGGQIGLADLPSEITQERLVKPAAKIDGDLSIKKQTIALERDLIVQALARTNNNRSQAAKLLEISYKTLVYKIRDYGIEV